MCRWHLTSVGFLNIGQFGMLYGPRAWKLLLDCFHFNNKYDNNLKGLGLYYSHMCGHLRLSYILYVLKVEPIIWEGKKQIRKNIFPWSMKVPGYENCGRLLEQRCTLIHLFLRVILHIFSYSWTLLFCCVSF